MLVDVHAHLEDDPDIARILQRARDAGVKTIINNGLDDESNRKTLALAKQHTEIQAALGLHPKRRHEDVEKSLEFIEANSRNMLAIGEIGLDYHWQKENQKAQKELFKACLGLATRLGKPVIVHSRDAEKDVLAMLRGQRRVVLHCFGGSMELVDEAVGRDYYFTIPATVVRSGHFQKLAKRVDLNRILTETDSPYLAPVPGEKNEPANIAVSIEKIAELKSVSAQEMANMIFMNYQKLFLQ